MSLTLNIQSSEKPDGNWMTNHKAEVGGWPVTSSAGGSVVPMVGTQSCPNLASAPRDLNDMSRECLLWHAHTKPAISSPPKMWLKSTMINRERNDQNSWYLSTHLHFSTLYTFTTICTMYLSDSPPESRNNYAVCKPS